jgi:hypothetical protein
MATLVQHTAADELAAARARLEAMPPSRRRDDLAQMIEHWADWQAAYDDAAGDDRAAIAPIVAGRARTVRAMLATA